MYAFANCSASIIRAVGTNAYGDPEDNPAADPLRTGVPAQIIVTSSYTTGQGDVSPRTVQRVTGTVGADTDIRKNDLLRDDTNSVAYTVRSVTQDNGIGHRPDLVLELDRLA